MIESLAWLEAVCQIADRPSSMGDAPMSMPADAGGGTVAMCQVLAVWLDRDLGYPAAPDHTVATVRRAFDAGAAPHPARLTMEAVRSWAGPLEVSAAEPCTACMGSGRDECLSCGQECDCEKCEAGTVTRLPHPRPGPVGGVAFDRQLVAALPAELTGPVEAHVLGGAEAAQDARLLLVGLGWRALVMCCIAAYPEGPDLLEGLAHAGTLWTRTKEEPQ